MLCPRSRLPALPTQGGCRSQAPAPRLGRPARAPAALPAFCALPSGFLAPANSLGLQGALGGSCVRRGSPCLWQEAGARLWKAAACARPAPPVSPRNTHVQPARVDLPGLLPRPCGHHLVPGCAALRNGLRLPALPGRPRHRAGPALLRAAGLSRWVSASSSRALADGSAQPGPALARLGGSSMCPQGPAAGAGPSGAGCGTLAEGGGRVPPCRRAAKGRSEHWQRGPGSAGAGSSRAGAFCP